MKKIFKYTLLAALAGMSLSAAADDVKLFSFTVPEGGAGQNFPYAISAYSEQTVKVDWGDGKLVDVVIAGLSAEELTTNVPPTFAGRLAGTTVTFYGADASAINYLDLGYTADNGDADVDGELRKLTSLELGDLSGLTRLYFDTNNIERVDLSMLTSLQSVSAVNNKLYRVTLPAAPVDSESGIDPLDGEETPAWVSPLKTVDFNNTVNVSDGTVSQGANAVAYTDWAEAPNLETLKVNGNRLESWESFDISKNLKLVNLYANVCDIPEMEIKDLPALKYIAAQWNKLESVVLPDGMAASMSVFLQHNALTSLSVANGAQVKTLNAQYNGFTFATLPDASVAKTFNYSPQNDVAVALNDANQLDLNACGLKVGDVETVVTFAGNDAEGNALTLTAGTEYTVADGVYTFSVPVKDLVATLTNSAYAKLTLKTAATTSPSLIPTVATFDVTGSDFGMLLYLSENSEYLANYGDGNYVALQYEEGLWGPDYVELGGKVVGTKVVVKGEPKNVIGVDYVASNWDLDPVKVSAADLTALENLETLALGNGNLENIDLSKNQKLNSVKLESNKLTYFDVELPLLETLSLANANSGAEKLYGENAISAFDATKYPALTSLNLSFTGYQPAWSLLAGLETLYVDGNGLTSAEIPVMENVKYLYLRWNKLAALDLSNVKSEAAVYAINNDIASIALPEQKLGNLYVANNKLTFATLPSLEKVGQWSNYAPQQPMEVTTAKGIVDLSSQAKVGDVETVYVWTVPAAEADAEPVVFDKYVANDGIFSFTEAAAGAVCSMTNEAFPALTLTTVALDVEKSAASVGELDAVTGEAAYYTLQGVRVLNPAEGLYIRVLDGKASKVLIRK